MLTSHPLVLNLGVILLPNDTFWAVTIEGVLLKASGQRLGILLTILLTIGKSYQSNVINAEVKKPQAHLGPLGNL